MRRLQPDGSRDEGVLQERVPLLTFTATRRGLWFASEPAPERPYWSIRLLPRGERASREITRLDFPPGNNLNLSLSPDERYLLITRPDERGRDLLLVDHVRWRPGRERTSAARHPTFLLIAVYLPLRSFC